MHQRPPSTIPSYRAALAGLAGDGPVSTLEAWRRLVVSARTSGRNAGDLTDDLTSALLVKLLDMQRKDQDKWRRLLSIEEPALKTQLQKMVRNLAMDLDPLRSAKRALAQQVKRALDRGLPASGGAPLDLWRSRRLDPGKVAAAAAWAMAQPDAPSRKPYRIANYLLRLYRSPALREAEALDQAPRGPDPGEAAERTSHAGRVREELRVRLAPEEATALELQLEGRPLETIATALGCGRTRAHQVATRARLEAEAVVAELEDEWQGW